MAGLVTVSLLASINTANRVMWSQAQVVVVRFVREVTILHPSVDQALLWSPERFKYTHILLPLAKVTWIRIYMNRRIKTTSTVASYLRELGVDEKRAVNWSWGQTGLTVINFETLVSLLLYLIGKQLIDSALNCTSQPIVFIFLYWHPHKNIND